MKIVSVINYKGGVGKTALTANLAAELAWHDKRVLMLDLDPQTSLTFSFILPDIWERDFSGAPTLTRLGQPDGISPSRMAEMLEVDKVGPKVRC